MTPETIDKLRQAFLWGATDEEACAFAGISKVTLYDYQKKHPDFLNQKEAWKRQPILAAKKKVVEDIKKKTSVAQWYLERKAKSEFSTRQELTGADGQRLIPILGGKSTYSDGDGETSKK